MVKGKFEGTVVREHSIPAVHWQTNPPRKFHATFVGGNRTGDWVTDPN
jgi:hypothetical protein